MSASSTHDFLAQVLALPIDDRLRIFDGLLASVTPPGDSCVDGEGFEDMLARRSQELRDGTVKAYSIDETIAAMRESLAKRSQS